MSNAERARRGTARADRFRENVVEFPVVKAPPQAPDWLGEDARAEWNRLVPIFTAAGTLSEYDVSMLAVLCDVWGQYMDARRRHLEVKAARIAEMRRLYAVFSLSPTGPPDGTPPEGGNHFANNGPRASG